MGLLDFTALVGKLFSESGIDDEARARATELAAQARGSSVTTDLLTNADGTTAEPIVSYLDEREQPEYHLRGGEVLISDGSGTVGRQHPSLETHVVVSDDRLLLVVGNRVRDNLFGVPHEDVRAVYVDTEEFQRYLVVDAHRDDEPMTFFVDVTLESDEEEISAGIDYVSERMSSGEGERADDETEPDS